ncbi:MAG: glycosyltransferase [Selenomonadaceae bacterium]|nr:glycosyltransferase [Selenomonadaceae bacterium]
MSAEKIPKISVIIPMYNVENYVGECLDSLLCQTFQDFEVIVVDDCSTDDSKGVVKGYRPKFKGRLRLVESEKNSGGCAVPRNIGMNYASGKYLFFLDSDDLIIKTAFEQLYSVAENFDADVVQCEKFYTSDTPNLKGATLTLKSFKPNDYVIVPTLETEDIAQRIIDFHAHKYVWTAWSKLLRRDFMVKNKIYNPITLNNEDLVFTIYCLSCAKRLVQFPDPVNIYRYRPGSILHTKITMTEYIRKWIRSFSTAFSCCDKFLSTMEFYKQNPEIKYLALDAITQDTFRKLTNIYQKFSAALLDDIIRDEFKNYGDPSAMAAFFFNMSIMYSIQIGTYLLNKNNLNKDK